jgi:sugar phosphate isomerase/epimerase
VAWRWSLPTVVLVPRGAWGNAPSRDERQRLFAWAADAGFDGIEISPRWLDVHALSRTELELLRADVDAAGLLVSGLNLNRCVLTRSPQAGEHRSRFERSVDVAVALGAELIVLSQSLPTLPAGERPPLRGDDVPMAEHARAAELIAAVAARAAEAGVKLSIELHDDGLTDTAAWCLWHVRACRAHRAGESEEGSAVGVNPDLGNICRGPHPLPDWERALRALATYANAWHIKNYRDARTAPIWDGDIDYRRAFDIMREVGFDGWVSIESYVDADVLWLQQVSLLWAKDASRLSRNREAACTPSSI